MISANASRARKIYQLGISFVEVLVASLLIAIALVPALDALQTGVTGSHQYKTTLAQFYHLNTRMEELLAEPFATLDAAAGSPTVLSSFSDAPFSNNRRLVYIARYDGDNADADNNPFTGGDADLLWILVELEGTQLSLESLSNAY